MTAPFIMVSELTFLLFFFSRLVNDLAGKTKTEEIPVYDGQCEQTDRVLKEIYTTSLQPYHSLLIHAFLLSTTLTA